MYGNAEDWENDLNEALRRAGEFSRFQGHTGDSPGALADALEESDAIDQILERAYVYARMHLDEDNRDSSAQASHDRAVTAIAKISAAMSFLTPELVSLPEDFFQSALESEPRLKRYRHALDVILRQKEHVLSPECENLLAQFSDVHGAPDQIFTMLNDADLKFGTIRDESGEDVTLTHGNYIKFMRSPDRSVRKQAYDRVYDTYGGLINTLTATYSASVKTDVTSARVRHYPSARAASLSGGNIPEAVYDSLVASVRGALPDLHRYMEIRKRLLGGGDMKMYDIYVPLIDVPDEKVPFGRAVEIACEALAPLGSDYIRDFRRGIDERWIDIYENEGKTSGAYSFGSYDSKPFVLMNYDETLQDVFTLVHEMGHSLNSLYTRRTQPFVYGGHSIFTAEVASTVNETLLMRYLLKTEKDPEVRKYLMNMNLESFRTTLFRQTQFAEFEDLAHREVERGGSLTADWLNGQYDKINSDYYGPALSPDGKIRFEWARIPHFYRAYYVYQYATGYSAANAIADRILTEGEPAQRDYLRFLAAGSSDDPVELLKIAGVDMSTKEPVDRALAAFGRIVSEFDELTK